MSRGIALRGGEKFVRRYRPCAVMADGNSGGYVGDCRGIGEREACPECDGKRCDDGVSRAGDVRDFLDNRSQMAFRPTGFEKRHALFAARDE